METGFVFDERYSFVFACADTNELYKKFDRIILIRDRHASKQDEEVEKGEGEG